MDLHRYRLSLTLAIYIEAILLAPFLSSATPTTDAQSLLQVKTGVDIFDGHMVLNNGSSMAQSIMQENASLPDWEHGSAAWKAARDVVEGQRSNLWDQSNACDRDVLHTSAPLTVLFSLTAFWQEVKARRANIGSTSRPLEIHVVGASYPFEGRSDWPLLSKSRPPNVPGIRVSLVLGTPFQSDNVPPMADSLENSMLQSKRKRHRKHPKGGTWSVEENQILCKGKGEWGTRELDRKWSKAQLCRKHGNGLEVFCLEEYYQDAKEKLGRPDLVVLFSPGFPQLERRSWDAELRWMLNDNVPILVSDVVTQPSWGRTVSQSGRLVPHGERWDVGRDGTDGSDEPEMTLSTMRIYGARTLGSFRGPFPILHFEDDEMLAKNAVVQMFRGYKPGQQPVSPPSAEDIAADEPFLESADWKALGVWKGLENSLHTPVSAEYDTACREHYAPWIGGMVKEKDIASLASAERAQCEELAICGKAGEQDGRQQPSRRWTAKDWILIFKLCPPDSWL